MVEDELNSMRENGGGCVFGISFSAMHVCLRELDGDSYTVNMYGIKI